MFGHMKAQPILTLESSSPDPAIAALVAITENAQPVRWIDFPASILLFVSVQGDPESGAFYVFDRKTNTWFWIDFNDQQYGGYSQSDFDLLIHEYDILSLVNAPACSKRLRDGFWNQENSLKWRCPPTEDFHCRLTESRSRHIYT